MPALQPGRELGSADPRHHDVGEQQVDRVAVRFAVALRLGAVARRDDLVAVPPQDRDRDGPDLIVVLDDQDRLRPPP
jgi:hypothetical protein